MLHELLEKVRYGFTGTRWGELPATTTLGVAALVPPGESATIMKDIANGLKTLQEALNRPGINDRAALDQDTQPTIQTTIRDIDDFLAILGVEAPPAEESTAPATPTPETKAEDQFSLQN
jgi:hypothetical protein